MSRCRPARSLGAPAVQLFLERARAVNPSLDLTDDNAAAIARVCVAVDGIPLAIELAAARTRVVTVEQLSEILEHDVYILGGTSRGGAARHRTIRATIDWSHDLLGEQEQVLLRRLSVFKGRWTLEMAEEVCSGSGIDRDDVLDVLAQLVDRSMVLVDARDVVARYRLLEPIRQYGLERLEADRRGQPVPGPLRGVHSTRMVPLPHRRGSLTCTARTSATTTFATPALPPVPMHNLGRDAARPADHHGRRRTDRLGADAPAARPLPHPPRGST